MSQSGPDSLGFGTYTRTHPSYLKERVEAQQSPAAGGAGNVKRARHIAREYRGWDRPSDGGRDVMCRDSSNHMTCDRRVRRADLRRRAHRVCRRRVRALHGCRASRQRLFQWSSLVWDVAEAESPSVPYSHGDFVSPEWGEGVPEHEYRTAVRRRAAFRHRSRRPTGHSCPAPAGTGQWRGFCGASTG